MCLYGGVFVVLLVNFLDMARRVRDFRTHEELSEYVNTIHYRSNEVFHWPKVIKLKILGYVNWNVFRMLCEEKSEKIKQNI